MCEVCRSHPCDPRCPNADDPKTEYFFCANCDGVTTDEDETYTNELGQRFCCLDCALDYHNIQKE